MHCVDWNFMENQWIFMSHIVVIRDLCFVTRTARRLECCCFRTSFHWIECMTNIFYLDFTKWANRVCVFSLIIFWPLNTLVMVICFCVSACVCVCCSPSRTFELVFVNLLWTSPTMYNHLILQIRRWKCCRSVFGRRFEYISSLKSQGRFNRSCYALRNTALNKVYAVRGSF